MVEALDLSTRELYISNRSFGRRKVQRCSEIGQSETDDRCGSSSGLQLACTAEQLGCFPALLRADDQSLISRGLGVTDHIEFSCCSSGEFLATAACRHTCDMVQPFLLGSSCDTPPNSTEYTFNGGDITVEDTSSANSHPSVAASSRSGRSCRSNTKKGSINGNDPVSESVTDYSGSLPMLASACTASSGILLSSLATPPSSPSSSSTSSECGSSGVATKSVRSRNSLSGSGHITSDVSNCGCSSSILAAQNIPSASSDSTSTSNRSRVSQRLALKRTSETVGREVCKRQNCDNPSDVGGDRSDPEQIPKSNSGSTHAPSVVPNGKRQRRANRRFEILDNHVGDQAECLGPDGKHDMPNGRVQDHVLSTPAVPDVTLPAYCRIDLSVYTTERHAKYSPDPSDVQAVILAGPDGDPRDQISSDIVPLVEGVNIPGHSKPILMRADHLPNGFKKWARARRDSSNSRRVRWEVFYTSSLVSKQLRSRPEVIALLRHAGHKMDKESVDFFVDDNLRQLRNIVQNMPRFVARSHQDRDNLSRDLVEVKSSRVPEVNTEQVDKSSRDRLSSAGEASVQIDSDMPSQKLSRRIRSRSSLLTSDTYVSPKPRRRRTEENKTLHSNVAETSSGKSGGESSARTSTNGHDSHSGAVDPAEEVQVTECERLKHRSSSVSESGRVSPLNETGNYCALTNNVQPGTNEPSENGPEEKLSPTPTMLASTIQADDSLSVADAILQTADARNCDDDTFEHEAKRPRKDAGQANELAASGKGALYYHNHCRLLPRETRSDAKRRRHKTSTQTGDVVAVINENDDTCDSELQLDAHATSGATQRMNSDEVVNCTCRNTGEDGLMVQCDICLCWQHGHCLGFSDDAGQLPDKHICYICRHPFRLRLSKSIICSTSGAESSSVDIDMALSDLTNERQFPYATYDWMPNFAAEDGSSGMQPQALSQAMNSLSLLMSGLVQLRSVLNALHVKLQIAELKVNNAKVYMWSSQWSEVYGQWQRRESPPTKAVSDVDHVKKLDDSGTFLTHDAHSPMSSTGHMLPPAIPKLIDKHESRTNLVDHIERTQTEIGRLMDVCETAVLSVSGVLDPVRAVDPSLLARQVRWAADQSTWVRNRIRLARDLLASLERSLATES